MSATAAQRIYKTTPEARAKAEYYRRLRRANGRTRFGDWIEKMGEKRIAAALGLATITPYVWKHAGYLPRQRWPEILVHFADEVTLADLLAMETDYRASLARKPR